jgi:hypothetical protein
LPEVNGLFEDVDGLAAGSVTGSSKKNVAPPHSLSR